MRQIVDLNKGWLYKDSFSDDCLTKTEWGAYTEVNLPHANKEIPYNYFDEGSYQFVSTYIRKIDLPEDCKGRRIFVDFEGVMAYAEIFLNGELLGSHKGGYTPFSFDITERVSFDEENILVVKVDSTERDDIPPFGNVIDYLTYGGIYREVFLRIVSPVYIGNVFAKPQDVLDDKKKVETSVYINNTTGEMVAGKITVGLSFQGSRLASTDVDFTLSAAQDDSFDVILAELDAIRLWDIDDPNLYELDVKISSNNSILDSYATRIGFREAVVKVDGFYLNGRHLKIRGLNRHQAFPYVGYAMPERVQKKDADILKHELHLNTVRTSHYPQSRHFLDRCDEIGLLVFEEIPGWQHIGDEKWKSVACEDVRSMIRRDWNHPSIFMWGVRINESPDDHDFYTRTNEIARELDPTRPTGGVRCIRNSEFLEDVFTANDFSHSGEELVLVDQKVFTGLGKDVPYMVTEYNGHMFPTKRFDQEERLMEHALRHARVQARAGSSSSISGAIGWCAFDYNTHFEFGSGDRICYHGVMDMFRIPKFAAGVYRSQICPAEEPVLEPVTLWARGERSIGGVLPLVILTNCDYIEVSLDGKKVGRFYPDAQEYAGLEYPPIVIKEISGFGDWGCSLFDGEFIGYHQDKEIIRKLFVKNPVQTKLEIMADDHKLQADGCDATRVVFKLVDQVGNLLPYIPEFVKIHLTGPGEIIGPKDVALIGGCIATWVRTTGSPGEIRVSAQATRLSSEEIIIESC